MEDNPEVNNFEEFKEHTKQQRMEELKKRMDDLREDLKAIRNRSLEKEEEYANIVEDDEYQVLLAEGDFTKDDHEIHSNRLYPSIQQLEEMREARKKDEKPYEEKFKYLESKVFIKEFQEDPETIKVKLANLKQDVTYTPTIPKIPNDLPISKQDIEKYIGENLIGKVAALVILVTIIVAYRYAISSGYIPTYARVLIGVLIGGGLFWGAHYLLSKKNTITTSLVLLGAVTLYYTAYLTYYDYKLINQETAFGANLFITILITIASVLYNRMRLAIISVFGGYMTPFIVGASNENYIFFFSYVFIINLCMMAIAYFKDWRGVNLVSYLASILFLVGWVSYEWSDKLFGAVTTETTMTDQQLIWLAIFASLFYLVFYVNEIIYNIKAHIHFVVVDFYIMLSVTILYVGGMLRILNVLEATNHISTFFLVLGGFNLLYTILTYGKDNVDDDLEELIMGKTLVITTLLGYLLLENVYINTYWAIESIILLWVGLKLNDKLVKGASLVTMVLAVFSMFYAWANAYYMLDNVAFMFNSGFWAGTITSLSLGMTILLLNENKEEFDIAYFPKESYTQALVSLLIFTSYCCGLFELLFHTKDTLHGLDFRVLVISAYNMFFILIIRFIVISQDIERLKVFTGTMMGLAVVSFLFYGHFNTISLRDDFLIGARTFFPFGFHYLNVGLSVLLVYFLLKDIVRGEGYASGKYSIVMWIMSIMFVTHATFELEHTVVLLRNGVFDVNLESVLDQLDQIRLTGYSILWSVIAFGFMYVGMQKKIKEMRLISLFLFGLTLVKFFIFDFWKLEPLWQIIASFIIGLLLLVLANMYKQLQRLVEKGELIFDRDTVTEQQAAIFSQFMNKKSKKEKGDDEE